MFIRAVLGGKVGSAYVESEDADGWSLGTNLIHDFTAVTFSVKLAFFREKRPFP